MPRPSLTLYYLISRILHWGGGKKRFKLLFEWLFWKYKKFKEHTFTNAHYEYFFTTHFGIEKQFYNSKKILDIGCGPRGSLDWAVHADERIGLDPLAKKYQTIQPKHSITKIVEGVSEQIPFPDEYFDVVSSFNSLDHVDDLEHSVAEIKRVLKHGGRFLLICDIHAKPTLTEPSAFSWNIVNAFSPECSVEQRMDYEGEFLYKSIRKNIPFDHTNTQTRVGILTAVFRKL